MYEQLAQLDRLELTRRHTEPSALVHSGYRWYLVAFDLGRDDWRTFRIDRIQGRVTPGGRGRRRAVPGGDPAAFVRHKLQTAGARDDEAPPGRVRIGISARRLRSRISPRYVTVEPDGADSSVVSTRGPWSGSFFCGRPCSTSPSKCWIRRSWRRWRKHSGSGLAPRRNRPAPVGAAPLRRFTG